MRAPTWLIVASGSLLTSTALAQGPGGPGGPGGGGGGGTEVSRLMRFDKDKNGLLTREELTDERLHRLFDRADANGDGSVTSKELEALAAAEPPGGGFGGPGGPGGPPPGGPGGPGGPRGGMGVPGEVLSAPVRRMLRLSETQAEQVEALQKEVDARLKKILTDDQNRQVQQIRERGPGGPGGRFGGPGGPGGPPPGGPGGRPGGPGGPPPPPRDF